MEENTQFHAFVSFPDARLTESLVEKALSSLNVKLYKHLSDIPKDAESILQWSTYDEASHELTMERPKRVLSSTYVIRKSLIRKHFLHQSIKNYLAKKPDSTLTRSIPPTWHVEIVHSDELDELWVDDLYDLAQILPDVSSDLEIPKWFILKPGMADRGMGIRLFNSKEGLQDIFNSFENNEDEDEGKEHSEVEGDGTAVMISQLRHFVVQEYLLKPLLIDPRERVGGGISPDRYRGRKFHLRAYCVAQGALKVHLFTRILALFSSVEYSHPSAEMEGSSRLSAHLTNTALQAQHGEENVRLLQELVGSRLFSASSQNVETARLTQGDVDFIIDEVAASLGEVFRACLTSPVHFQTLPNAFELFGVDLLVTYNPAINDRPFQVHLLELNAEPAIHLTGPRLEWILEELFNEISHTCVMPFFCTSPLRQESKGSLRLCLDTQVRGGGAW
ncbi:hypothetical protein FRC15_001975 [Serendipita sp. 397]|nr:hypothetical protein FRC15_001975 [Serendipita sp. 397]